MITSKTRTLAGVMLRSGSSYREVSEALEISVGSVHNISREDMDYLEPLVMEMKRRSAYRCYLLADHTLNRMSDVDFEGASLKEKSVAAGVLFDKATMLDGVMPKADPEAWDRSKPGEMGRLYRPEGDNDDEESYRYLLMKLFMQGRDADALRIGLTLGMDEEDIEECRVWQRAFAGPATLEEAFFWKRDGKLRLDYDSSRLPWNEEEKAEWERAERRKRLSGERRWRRGPYDEDDYDEDDVDEEPEEEAEIEDADTASDTSGTGGEHGTEASRTDSPAPPEVGMRRVLNERFLNGLNALKAKMELNGIEQAVNAQLDERYGKIPGPDEEK
jgi:hypothetical protein